MYAWSYPRGYHTRLNDVGFVKTEAYPRNVGSGSGPEDLRKLWMPRDRMHLSMAHLSLNPAEPQCQARCGACGALWRFDVKWQAVAPWAPAQGRCGRSSLPLSDGRIATSIQTEARIANVKGVELGAGTMQIAMRHTCPDDRMVLPARCRSGSRYRFGVLGITTARISEPVHRVTEPLPR